MRLVPSLVLLAMLAGCGAPDRRAVEPSPVHADVPARPDPPSAEPAPRASSPCDDLPAAIVVTAPPVHMQCADGHRQCVAEARLEVRDCTAEPVELVELRVTREDGATVTFTPEDGHLAPGASFEHTSTVFREGRHAVVAEVRRGEGAGERTELTERVELRVDNPALEAAMEACRACDGDWGGHGMLGLVGCNCATRDAGQRCRDADDCEGDCLFERFEVVQEASRHCAHGTCTVTPATGRPVGRCAPRRATFGCRARLPSGAAAAPPVRLPARAPTVCVD